MNFKDALDEVSGFIKLEGDRVFDKWHEVGIDTSKDGIDITTNYDLEVERNFAEFVEKHFPEHGFVGEEVKELNRDGEYVWHIDPIDGTKFFANGIPFWGVTVALVKGDEPMLGLIYNPVAKQLHHAVRGEGAFLGDQRLVMSEVTDPEKIQLAWDLTTRKYDWDNLQDQLAGFAGQMMKDFYRVRMLGNGAYALGWLAQGLFGAYMDPYRHKDKFVDIAAGILIAEESGATVFRNNLGNDLEQIIVAKPKVIEFIKPKISLK